MSPRRSSTLSRSEPTHIAVCIHLTDGWRHEEPEPPPLDCHTSICMPRRGGFLSSYNAKLTTPSTAKSDDCAWPQVHEAKGLREVIAGLGMQPFVLMCGSTNLQVRTNTHTPPHTHSAPCSLAPPTRLDHDAAVLVPQRADS